MSDPKVHWNFDSYTDRSNSARSDLIIVEKEKEPVRLWMSLCRRATKCMRRVRNGKIPSICSKTRKYKEYDGYIRDYSSMSFFIAIGKLSCRL